MQNKLCVNLHHVSLLVSDVDEAFNRYEMLLGLHGEIDNGLGIMRCMHEDFCLVLKPANDEKPFLEYVAYELNPGLTLDQAKTEIESRGESVELIDVPRRGQGLKLVDPDGNVVVLIQRVKPSDHRPQIMIETKTLRGYHPRRLGHVNYLTSDCQRVYKWYSEILGFKLTDWIGDGAFWMNIDARHHVLAFLNKGHNHIHHIAFEFAHVAEITGCLDHIAKHGRYVSWGPVRHGMAQNLATYWRMWEEEHFIEIYCDMQVLDEDHVPVTHEDNAYSSNTWGILPPRSYFEFEPEIVEKERQQLHAFVVI